MGGKSDIALLLRLLGLLDLIVHKHALPLDFISFPGTRPIAISLCRQSSEEAGTSVILLILYPTRRSLPWQIVLYSMCRGR